VRSLRSRRQVATTMSVKGEGSAAEQIFEKLKAVEDARKQLWWYRAAVFTFDPNGRLRTYWDVFLMCLVLYSGFISPFRAVFERPTGSVELEQTAEDWLIDALFYMDIVLNFFTGYDNGYQIVTGKIEIAKKYVFLSGRGGGFFWVRFSHRTPLRTMVKFTCTRVRVPLSAHSNQHAADRGAAGWRGMGLVPHVRRSI
jgi:hypothetical protein